MAKKENNTIKVTVSQPAIDAQDGEISQTMLMVFGQWFKGDPSQPDWNDRDENSPGHIRNRPDFRGEWPMEVTESNKLVMVSISESLLSKILAVTDTFWMSPLTWDNEQQWKSL